MITITHGTELAYFSDEHPPAEPLKAYGVIDHLGWDIPSYWAIDANGVVYANLTAHGRVMEKSSLSKVLRSARLGRADAAETMIRKALNMKPAPPEWMRLALRFGWTPPPHFKKDEYDTSEP